MILANRNGWLSVVNVVKETKKYYHLQNIEDPNKEAKIWKLHKEDNQRALFDSAFEAEIWILLNNRTDRRKNDSR